MPYRGEVYFNLLKDVWKQENHEIIIKYSSLNLRVLFSTTVHTGLFAVINIYKGWQISP
jgi:hypothetical protein